jgi:hypothetical protein
MIYFQCLLRQTGKYIQEKKIHNAAIVKRYTISNSKQKNRINRVNKY